MGARPGETFGGSKPLHSFIPLSADVDLQCPRVAVTCCVVKVGALRPLQQIAVADCKLCVHVTAVK